MAIQIKEFAAFEGIWRLDWLGRIVPRGVEGPVPRIAVHLAELQPTFRDPLSNASLAQPHRTVQVLVDVGLLTLLRIGSVWHKGFQILALKELARDTQVVHWQSFQLVRLDGHIELNGRKVQLLPPLRHKVGGSAYRDIAESWAAVAISSEPNNRTQVLIIPSAVLFQSALATSPAATRLFIHGKIDKIVDTDYGRIAEEPNTFRINLFKNFKDSEGPRIANLLADVVATREYRRMRAHLIASSVNHVGPGEPKLHIRFGIPFSNETTLQLAGKRIPFGGERDGLNTTVWGFLATQILSLNVPLVFSRLVIDRKNDGRKGANSESEDLDEAWFTKPLEILSSDGSDQTLTSEEAPGEQHDNIAIQAPDVFTPLDLEVLKEEKDVQRYRGSKQLPLNGEPFNGLSSTFDAHGNSGTAPADVIPIKEPVIPVTLQHLFDALDVLARDGLIFETIVVSISHQKREADGRIVNFFRSNDRRVRSWRRMSASFEHTRAFVVAAIYVGGVWHYLIDIEHKRAGELSMLLLRSENGIQVEARRLDYFMEAVAKHNGWQATEEFRSYWRFTTIRHAKQRGPEALASQIHKSFMHPY